MTTLQAQILEKISKLDTQQQEQILVFVEKIALLNQTYTASELMQLPFEKRDAILRAQLILAAHEDFETFEAYSEENLNDDF